MRKSLQPVVAVVLLVCLFVAASRSYGPDIGKHRFIELSLIAFVNSCVIFYVGCSVRERASLLQKAAKTLYIGGRK